jgi:hypothetical protein
MNFSLAWISFGSASIFTFVFMKFFNKFYANELDKIQRKCCKGIACRMCCISRWIELMIVFLNELNHL